MFGLTPCVGKVDDEDPNEDDGSPSGALVGVKCMLERADNTGNDKVADSHADTAGDQDLLPSNVVDPEDGGNGKHELEDTGHTGGQQGGGGAAQLEILEDLRTIMVRSVRCSLDKGLTHSS